MTLGEFCSGEGLEETGPAEYRRGDELWEAWEDGPGRSSCGIGEEGGDDRTDEKLRVNESSARGCEEFCGENSGCGRPSCE